MRHLSQVFLQVYSVWFLVRMNHHVLSLVYWFVNGARMWSGVDQASWFLQFYHKENYDFNYLAFRIHPSITAQYPNLNINRYCFKVTEQFSICNQCLCNRLIWFDIDFISLYQNLLIRTYLSNLRGNNLCTPVYAPAWSRFSLGWFLIDWFKGKTKFLSFLCFCVQFNFLIRIHCIFHNYWLIASYKSCWICFAFHIYMTTL